jgi:hypothetical protein
MKRISQTTFLLTILAAGFSPGTVAADEPVDKPQPKLIQAKQSAIQAVKQQQTFSGLLQKGQTVTLYQFSQEAQTGYQYQVRIVNEDQKKQIEDVVARNAKQLDDYNNQKAELEEQLLATYEGRIIMEPERNTELKKAINELRETYKPTSLTIDVRSATFYTISDVGGDYVGFERNGVKTFHRLSSIHRIIRGVEIDGE